MTEAQPLFDYVGHLPECPTWSAEEGCLYWTDIPEQEIHRYHLASASHDVIQFPEEVGCFALREKDGFIVAMRSGIYLTRRTGLITHKVCDNPSNPELARFNDGGTDPWGRFYAGTFWAPGDYQGALLCRIDNDLTPHIIQHGIQGANGLAFSPDGRWMYTSDSPHATIYRTPLDDKHEPGTREVFKHFAPGDGLPDGAAIDTEGCYWTALYDGGRVIRLSPEGVLLADYPLPVPNPTMVCFGGEEMKTLFITTTCENMDAQARADSPLSGAIFTLHVPVAGMAKSSFREQRSDAY